MTARDVSTIPGWNPDLELIFSSRDGYVWVSWPDADAAVKLGRHEMVAAMMQDFLAQVELSERLEHRDGH